MADPDKISLVEKNLHCVAEFLLHNFCYNINSYEASTPTKYCSIDTKHLKCNIENSQLRGDIDLSWPIAYINHILVAETGTIIKGSFNADGKFTGAYILTGKCSGEKLYVNGGLIYARGKWLLQDTAPTFVKPQQFGKATIHYTPDGHIDYTRSWQKDDQGRDLCLPAGDTAVYKLCKTIDDNEVSVYCYVKLFVPAGVKRIPLIPFTTKTRVEKAYVEDIFDGYGNRYKKAKSFVYGVLFFKYIVGEWVIPDSFDERETISCSHGLSVHKYIDHCDQWKSPSPI